MTQSIPTLPDEVAKRPLHFFWLLDWSGSMSGTRIASLNQALREAIPEVRKAISGPSGSGGGFGPAGVPVVVTCLGVGASGFEEDIT